MQRNRIHTSKTPERAQTQRRPTPIARAAFGKARDQSTEIRSILAGSSIQPKLKVGDSKSPEEREADRIAEMILRHPITSNAITATPNPSAIEHPAQRAETARQNEIVHRSEQDEEKEEKEEEPLQAKAAPGGVGSIANDIESRIQAARGRGHPMPGSEREFFGSRFGRDFSDVNFHTGQAAAKTSTAINARAFTVGRDVFFGAGQYAPSTTSGRRLIAHELTHVVQQGHGGSIIRRAALDTPEVDGEKLDKSVGQLNLRTKTITFDSIEIPPFKAEGHRGKLYSAQSSLKRQKNYNRGSPNQRDKWRKNLSTTNIETKLRDKLIEGKVKEKDISASKAYLFQANTRDRAQQAVFGKLKDVAANLTTPTWGHGNEPPYRQYDVDHIVELQLAGWSDNTTGNDLANMELLDSSLNRKSGSFIKDKIIEKASGFVEATHGRYGADAEAIKNKYHLEFETFRPASGSNLTAAADDFWIKQDIEAGKQVDAISLADPKKLSKKSDAILVFPTMGGGIGKGFSWTAEPGVEIPVTDKHEQNWLSPFRITKKSFTPAGSGNIGSFKVDIPDGHPVWKPVPETDELIKRIGDSESAGALSKASIKSKATKLAVNQLSPIKIDSVDVSADEGLSFSGNIDPTLPLLKGTPIEFESRNGAVRIQKTFTQNDLTVPKPFDVRESSLTVFADSDAGLGMVGQASVALDKLGEGFLKVKASSGGPFSLSGEFDVASSLFDKSTMEVSYVDGVVSGRGELGISEGKVNGIKSASVTAEFKEKQFTATGIVEPDVPGVDTGSMTVSYSELNGLSMAGTLEFGQGIPGIKTGTMEARLDQRSDGSGYKVAASGSAEPDLPYVDTQLSATYDDGFFDLTAQTSFETEIGGGSINIGVTNRELGKDGQPVNSISKRFFVYGGGTINAVIPPYLRGEIGAQLTRDGEIHLRGEIGLKDPVKLMKARKFDHDFPIPSVPPIPIASYVVADVVLEIEFGLSFHASIGPAMLDTLGMSVFYVVGQPERTEVVGQASASLPSNVGLNVSAKGGVAARVLQGAVKASGSLKVGGDLGIEATGTGTLDSLWTPKDGFSIDGLATLEAEPYFILKITLIGEVSSLKGTMFETIWWYREAVLKEHEFRMEKGLKVTAPLKYRDNEPFAFSYKDIEIEKPEINAESFMKALYDDAEKESEERN